MTNKGQSQIVWGINLFRIFIVLATRHGSLNAAEATAIHNKLSTLQNQPDISELNSLIQMTNEQMKARTDKQHYAPFPSFSLVENAKTRSAMMDQLDMVERTLSEAACAEVIDWKVEDNYFADVLKILNSVEKGELHPSDAVAALNVELGKINATLPSDLQLPTIDLSDYEAFA